MLQPLGPRNRKRLRSVVDRDWLLDRYGVSIRQYFSLIEKGSPEAGLIDPNGLFDSEWYSAEYGLRPNQVAVLHYLRTGWRSGNKPGPHFDPALYKGSAPERTNIEPLGDFLRSGRENGVLPFAPLHDVCLEIIREPRLADLASVLRRAIKRQRMLDLEWYAWKHGLGDTVEAELHYWASGFAKNLAPNAFLDPDWYLKTNRDVEKAGWSPVLHYMIEGWNQGRDPSLRLSLDWFWRNNDREEPIRAFAEGRAQPSSIAPRFETSPPHRLSDLQLGNYYAERELLGPGGSFDRRHMDIHWIVPDFGPGSGGHTNIFRFARMLQDRGHSCRIWVDRPILHRWDDDLAVDLDEWYGNSSTPIDFLPPEPALSKISGDAVIATGWQTTYPARALSRFRRRFCLVQDYETYFSPVGSHYFASRSTYDQDFDCLCAGPWLEHLMREQHGRWATMFWLSPNREIYFPGDRPPHNDIVHVVAYARDHTSRRCVELLEAALTNVGRRGIPIKVEAFGLSDESILRWRRLGVEVTCHGYLDPEDVADLYRRADLGISLSGTNYSSVPPDMMACGLPVLELKTQATSMTFEPGVVVLAEPTVTDVADSIADLAQDRQRLIELGARGKAWIDQHSWDDGTKSIEDGIANRIESRGAPSTTSSSPRTPLASIVIPTFNGGELFPAVVKAVLSQKCDFDFELVVVDSSSTDGTAERAEELGCRVTRIDQSQFQHGRTRNFAVELARGEFVAMLTQDALPASRLWLRALVQPLLDDNDVAGVFGRHTAHEGASRFTANELDRHFAGFLQHPLVVNRRLDPQRYQSGDPGWRQFLYFYSDNNSCLRKSVWRTLPYPAVKFGEDQAWAQLIIDAGWSKAYAPEAVVHHSHEFDADETRIRAAEEALFFRERFGHMAITHPLLLKNLVEGEIANNIAFANQNIDVSAAELEHRNALSRAKLEGLLAGAHNVDPSRTV